jgi:predicted O-methyltransferase YrrM
MIDINHSVTFIKDYILFKLLAKSSAGHGIHSPLVYEFTRSVVNPKTSVDQLKEVEWYRNWQIETPINVRPSSFGARSKPEGKTERLGTVIKNSSVSPKTGAFLFRLAKWQKAQNILELGTSVGVSAMYLASANRDAKVYTLEGDRQRATLAQTSFDYFNLNNIRLIEGDFDQGLNEALDILPQLDLVFFDGNHAAEPTLRYFKRCLKKGQENSVFVFHDIRWSKEMYKAWKVISKHSSVSISIDLFYLGVVFFRKGILKQNFKINF